MARNIGEMVKLLKERTPAPNPDGGIGGLTDAEVEPWTDLLNAPGTVCECGDKGCCSPLPRNPDRKPGA